MLRLLSDECFSGPIIRGLIRRQPNLDLIRVQDIGLMNTADPDILEWAAGQERIVLTHDRETMPGFAYDRVMAGLRMPGVFVVDDQMAIGQAIDDLLLLAVASRDDEYKGRVVFIPLQQ